MKRVISLLLSVSVFFCLFSFNVFATKLNNDVNKAIAIQDGSMESFTFRTDLYDDNYDQYRWYKINPQKSGIYRFHLENLYSSDSDIQIYLNIYDPTDEWNKDSEPGEFISISGSTYLTEQDKYSETDILLKQDITYYIEIYAEASYDFNVDIDLQMSVNIIDNQLYVGQLFTESFNRILNNNSHSRIYSFVPNNNLTYEKYDIVISSSKLKNEDYVVVYLEDENGKNIDYNVFGYDGDDIIFTNSLKSGSKYYLIIESSSPNKFDITINIIKHHIHKYQSVVTSPTAIKLGHRIYTCSICGYSYNIYKAPTGKLTTKCKAKTTAAQTITWNRVSTATGYQVQISTKDGKKWSTYAVLKANVNSYTFKKLTAGNAYKFRARFFIKAADGNNYYSPWSNTLSSSTLPTGTNITKLTGNSKSFNAQWKKNSTVNGYQVQYSLKSNFSGAKTVTIKSNNTLKTTVKKLHAKKVYYVRIRTYKTISKVNCFSSWSKSVKVKTKS